MARKMVPAVEWQHIKEDYRFYRNDTDFDMLAECREHGDWQRVYKEGCDSKWARSWSRTRCAHGATRRSTNFTAGQ